MSRPEKIHVLRDPQTGQLYDASRCHRCRKVIDWRRGDWYQDSLGRWEFCGGCYVHAPHPSGETLAWWYAVECSREMERARLPH